MKRPSLIKHCIVINYELHPATTMVAETQCVAIDFELLLQF